jgi:hypothetical protein
MSALRTAYRIWGLIMFVAVLVQVGAAGYGAFYVANKLQDKGDTLGHEGWDHGWSFHSGFGTIVVIGLLILLILALAVRVPRPAIWFPVALGVAAILQIVFAEVGRSAPSVGFLHPLNALVIFSLTGLIAHRAWRGDHRHMGGAPAAPAPTPPPAA